MKISVFGLGYVGTVTAGFLADAGHDVVCVDISQTKIDLVKSSSSPIYENGMQDLISRGVADGRLTATFDARAALNDSELSFITVGTPAGDDRHVDTSYLKRICTKIGQVLANKDGFHTFVVRCPVVPGTTDELVIPTIEDESGKKVFLDFDVCVNPHFMRVGSLVEDYRTPPLILIGQQDDRSGDRVAQLFDSSKTAVVRTSLRTAELVTYASDAFHALKVCFANEIGALCKTLDIDSHEVMNILKLDEKLTISGAYLSPGLSFGGPALPSSIKTLVGKSEDEAVELPAIASLLESNEEHRKRALSLIMKSGKKKIGLIGLAFKAGTDEVRNSPMLDIAADLIDNDIEVMIYDSNVQLSKLMDSNKDYLESKIMGAADLMAGSFDQLFNWADVIVIGQADEQFEYLVSLDTDKVIIDLVRISEDLADSGGNYRGICW